MRDNTNRSFDSAANGAIHRLEGSGLRPRPMGVGMRLLCHVAAVNPERLAKCPLDDWQATARTAFALLASYLFTTATVTGALAIAFGLQAAQVAMMVPMAALVTFTIVLVDQAIIQAHWFRAGVTQAHERGFLPDGPRGPGWLRCAVTFCFRLALSGALAFVVAGFVQLLVFSHDISRQMADTHRTRNAAVFAHAERRVDAEIALRDGEIATLGREHAAALTRYDDTVREVAAALRTQTAARDARLAQLREARDAQLAEAQRRRGDAVHEEFGTKGADYNSGVPGKKANFNTATALAELAEARARALLAEIAAVQAVGPGAAGAMDISAARQEIERVSERRRSLSAERDVMVASRNAAMLTAAQADPAFVPMQEGLFAEWTALHQVTREPSAWLHAQGINLLIMLVELAGVLVRTIVASPSLYAARTAAAFEVDTTATIARAEPAITASTGVTEEAQESRQVLRDEHEQRQSRRQTAARARQHFGDDLF